MKKFIRFLPLLIIIIAFALAIYFRLYRFLSFDMLKSHYKTLEQWTDSHYLYAVLGFMLVYIIAVAISIPGATILTILGGFLFGTVFGTTYVVISATLGACIIFLAVQTSLGRWLENKASGWVSRMESGFQDNAFSYTLFLRLVPLFPFWVVNIVPALLDVRLSRYALATFIGIIPGSLVYASVGNGLDALFALGKTPDLGIIFKPSILVPILGLAVLSLIPIVYKKIKAKK